MKNKVWIGLIGLISLFFTGCLETSNSSNSNNRVDQTKNEFEKLQIKDVKFREVQSKSVITDEMMTTHEFAVIFNRPITPEELEPQQGYKFHYQIKSNIYFKDGNKIESWGKSPIMDNLGKSKTEEVIARDYTSRDYNPKDYSFWRKDNIDKVEVELFFSEAPEDLKFKTIDKKVFSSF